MHEHPKKVEPIEKVGEPAYNPLPVGTRKLLMAMSLFDEPNNVVDLNANVVYMEDYRNEAA